MRIYSANQLCNKGLVYAPVMHLKSIILVAPLEQTGRHVCFYVSKRACTMTCQSDCFSKSQEYIYMYIYIKHETTNKLSDAHQTAPLFVSKPCSFLCLLSGRKRPVHVTGGNLVHRSSLSLISALLIH